MAAATSPQGLLKVGTITEMNHGVDVHKPFKKMEPGGQTPGRQTPGRSGQASGQVSGTQTPKQPVPCELPCCCAALAAYLGQGSGLASKTARAGCEALRWHLQTCVVSRVRHASHGAQTAAGCACCAGSGARLATSLFQTPQLPLI